MDRAHRKIWSGRTNLLPSGMAAAFSEIRGATRFCKMFVMLYITCIYAFLSFAQGSCQLVWYVRTLNTCELDGQADIAGQGCPPL